MIDVVYILGNGSHADDAEIKYSLRSLAKNMLDIGNIFVVGSCPDFLQNVVHIPADDIYPEPWKNALHKIKIACADARLSNDFLLMNDDFFMIEPFNGADFPYYAIKGSNGGPSGMHSFQVHCPIRLNKTYFPQIPLSVEMRGHFSPRSFYGNFYKAKPEFIQDFILRPASDFASLDKQINARAFFSTSDDIFLDPIFIDWIETLLPVKSEFEK